MAKNWLRRVVTGTALATVLVANPAIAAADNDVPSPAPGISVQAEGVTKLYGGTGDHAGVMMEQKLRGTIAIGSTVVVPRQSHEDFYPSTGTEPFDVSRAQTTGTMVGDIASDRNVTQTVGAYSQSASSLTDALVLADQQGMLSKEQTKVIMLSNPREKVSGIESRLGGLALPGVTFKGEELLTGVQQVEYCRQWDGICHTPNLADPDVVKVGVQVTNAVCGYFVLHMDYDNVDLSQARVRQFDNATYATIPTAEAPLITLARDRGAPLPEPIAAWIQSVALNQPDPGPEGPIVSNGTTNTSTPETQVATSAPVNPQVEAVATQVKSALPVEAAPVVDQIATDVQNFLNILPH